jgi:uncharacterized protein YjbI with pentapeptide repeats
MADIFVLNYLLQTLTRDNGAADWSAFKRKQTEGIDLAQADLENRPLRGYDLSEANLSAGRLYNADLSEADLSGARLAYADMRRANLANACLAGAELSGALMESVNAAGADFRNAQMRGCKLREARLAGARLAGADLQNASLRGADLKGADLTGARIEQADIEQADPGRSGPDDEAGAPLHRPESAAVGEPGFNARSAPAEDSRHSPLSEEDCCAILGLDPGASVDQIAKAYRRKVMQCHPDRVRHLGPEFQGAAEREFDRVQKAYRRLLRARSKPRLEGEDGVSQISDKSLKEFALYDLLELAKANPNNDRVFYNLGLKYFEEGMIDRALEAYQKALQLNPKNRFAQHNLKIARLSLTLGAEGG